MNTHKYAVITRSATQSDTFAEQLRLLGLEPFYCPTIAINRNLSNQELKEYFSQIASYDWILFTSANGVKFFMEGLDEIKKNKDVLANCKIAVVGEKTREILNEYGLSSSFTPSSFTAIDLAKEIPGIDGKTVLLPRSTIGNAQLITLLESRGATILEMPVYSTELLKNDMTEFQKRLEKKQIQLLTFTSPSTVTGFMQNLDKQANVISIPVCSIGPTTSKMIKEYGFTNVFTAKTQTTDAMITEIRKNIL